MSRIKFTSKFIILMIDRHWEDGEPTENDGEFNSNQQVVIAH